MKRILYSIAFCLALFSVQTVGQAREKCSSMDYEDKNQVTPPALAIRSVKGRIFIEDGKLPLVDSCVGLFSEDKKLVATAVPNQNGEFRFKKIPNGNYRLVVRHNYGFYCTANIVVVVNANPVGNPMLLFHMKPEGIDDCSFVDFAK